MRKFSLLLLFLGGCAVGPNYRTPETAVPDNWQSTPDVTEEMPPTAWWDSFHDDLLTKYIELATEYNFDLQTAESNILRAKALRKIAASQLFPQLAFDLNGTKTYFSKNGPVFAIGQSTGNQQDTTSGITGLPFSVQIPQIQNLFNALFDASWEIDLFGKTRRTIEAIQAQYESIIEHRNDVLLSVQAEVARAYIDLRKAQERARLLELNASFFEEQAAIERKRLEVGYADQFAMEEIEAQLALSQAPLPDTYAEIYRAIYTLSNLIGRLPETLVDELLPLRPLPDRPTKVAVGVRSDLLRRRPDIRFAERRLAEATAGVGVAVASFFPTISLLATGGFQSLVLPELFEWGSKTWAYGADVNMPIFQGGRLVGSLQFSRAEQAMQAVNYQQAIVNAIREAETNLKQYQEAVATTKENDKRVLHTTYVVTIGRERHIKGLVNKIDLLDNEKELASAELSQLDSRAAELTALVALYKSLGGNWDDNRDPVTEVPAPVQCPDNQDVSTINRQTD